MITPKEVTPKIFMDFFYWVQLHKKTTRTYAVKTSYTLKALINYAVLEGYAPYNPLLSVKLKKGAKKEPEALTPAQVETLYNYKFESHLLQKVADYALLQCYTGLAYSDLKEFDPFKHIEVDPKYGEFINKNRKKTDTKSLLPLLPRAKEIINKYIVIENGETKFTLKIMANSLYNQYLKVIESKLNFGVHFTTHICRRTYGALRLDTGIDIFRVSKEMGHKNIQETIDNYAVLLRKLEISKEK
jgi:site-specific recombinase XerD